jgi:hypothetical protein
MNNDIAIPSPEWLSVANQYIQSGSATETAKALGLEPVLVTEVLARKDVREYLNQIYLDMGYRNRSKLGAVMDKLIESKLLDAEESGLYTTKDLADLLMMAHKMRMEEIKATTPAEIKNQTNVQINGDNYGKLMERLLSD